MLVPALPAQVRRFVRRCHATPFARSSAQVTPPEVGL